MVESVRLSAAARSYLAFTHSHPSLIPEPTFRPASFASFWYLSLFFSYSSRVGRMRRLSVALTLVLVFAATTGALAFVLAFTFALAFSLPALSQPASKKAAAAIAIDPAILSLDI